MQSKAHESIHRLTTRWTASERRNSNQSTHWLVAQNLAEHGMSWIPLIAACYHIVCFLIDLYYYVWTQLNLLMYFSRGFGGQYQYLTQLNHIAQMTYFGIASVQDVCVFLSAAWQKDQSSRDRNKGSSPSEPESVNKNSMSHQTSRKFPLQKTQWLGRLLESLYSINFTLATTVGVLFWTMFFYDRKLILPPQFDTVYPFHVNVFQHGIVAIFMWGELFVRALRHAYWAHFYPHEYETVVRTWIMSHATNMRVTSVISLLYIAWLHILFRVNNSWTYPFLAKLDVTGHLIWNVISWMATIMVSLVGYHSGNRVKDTLIKFLKFSIRTAVVRQNS